MTDFSDGPGGASGSGVPQTRPIGIRPVAASSPAGSPDAGPGSDPQPPPIPPIPIGRPRQPDDEPPAKPGSGFVSLLREVALVMAIALGLSLLIKTFLVQAFFIPSQSMQNTLTNGDRVLVSKLTPGPFDLKRGDVVVFKDPDHWLTPSISESEGPIRDGVRNALTWVGLLPAQSDEHLIKRVIGLPGDTVACCDEKGRLTVNGTPIDEPYVHPGNGPSKDEFSQKVPAGNLWVMGDHRAMSQDSRYHSPGFVPIHDVVGRAFVLVWPLDRLTLLRNPSSTFANVHSP